MSQAIEIRDNLHFMLIAELKRGLSDVSRSVSVESTSDLSLQPSRRLKLH